MLDDAWEVRCDVNGEKDDCQAWQSQATLSRPAKKDGGWGGRVYCKGLDHLLWVSWPNKPSM
jgi:hypothetical protein